MQFDIKTYNNMRLVIASLTFNNVDGIAVCTHGYFHNVCVSSTAGVFEDASAEQGKDHANSSGCRVATSASEVGAGSAGSLSANLEPIAGTSYSVNCSADVYETPSRLEKSKAYVNEQIRRLRSQLFELKVSQL